MDTPGLFIIFGSGETSERGKAIHRHVLSGIGKKQNVAILETPAGFQPNSQHVAESIAQIFRTTLSQFVKEINVIPARKKGTDQSPDNKNILEPLNTSDYIFLGPGSPTYALRQLENSEAIGIILEKWKKGANICLSSAAAIAGGEYVLPVYEIYKAGADLHWERGLNILSYMGITLSFVTHYNNREGGRDLDTRFCYMGLARYQKLLKLLPGDSLIMGIDEHTAVILDFERKIFYTEGTGSATLLNGGNEEKLNPKTEYPITSLSKC